MSPERSVTVEFCFGLLIQLWLKAELAKKANADVGVLKDIGKIELQYPRCLLGLSGNCYYKALHICCSDAATAN